MKVFWSIVVFLSMALFTIWPVCADDKTGIGSAASTPFFVTIDPVGDPYSGDLIRLQGTTNLPPPDTLRVQVYGVICYRGFHRTCEGISQNVTIIPGGSGTENRWSSDMETNNWSQDEYLIKADSYDNEHVFATRVFNLFRAEEHPIATLHPGETVIPPSAFLTLAPVTSATTIPARPSPISLMVAPGAIGTLLIVTGFRKRKR